MFFLLIWFVGFSHQSDVSLVYRYTTKDLRCITNSSFPMIWVDSNVTEEYNEASVFIPIPQRNTDLDFGRNLKKPWTLQNSLQGNVSTLIFDRRWEGLTTHVTGNESDEFIVVTSKLKDNFTIPFSLRIKQEAHIYLCDGDDVYTADCYWFLLQSYGGNKTSVRVCQKERRTTLQENDCFINLNVKNHPYDYPSYLSEKEWRHFTLEKTDFFSIYRNIGLYKDTILKFVAQEPIIKITHMIIRSNNSMGFWKIHETDYIYTETEIDNIQMGPAISTINKLICVSMFVSMCSTCDLKLTLKESKGSGRILKEKTFRQGEIGWNEIKFFENINTPEVLLLVSTTSTKKTQQFWAIDKPRQCQEKEYRMITSKKFPSCQLITDKTNETFSFSNVQNTGPSVHCSEDTIGKFCIPCSWTFPDECGRAVICDWHNNSKSCSCSAGKVGKYCNTDCESGQYGHGCRKKCGVCEMVCDSIDGACGKCLDRYSGRRCDIAPATVFARAANISAVTTTELLVHVTDFEVINVTKSSPQSYTIQYKKVEEENRSWMTHEESYTFNRNYSVKVEGLQACTKYFIRCFITTADRKKHIDDRIPQVLVTTKCDGYSWSLIILIVVLSALFTGTLFTLGLLLYRFVINRVRSKKATIRTPEDHISHHDHVLNRNVFSKPVATNNFHDYVKTAFKKNELNSQCLTILKKFPRRIYAEIVGDLLLDYIDMHYTDAHIPKAYLVGAVPDEQLIPDFWKMVWEKNVNHIVMLEDNSPNNIKYWPEKKKLVHSGCTVQPLSKQTWGDYEHRKFLLLFEGKTRQVDHYLFTSWSGSNLPLSALPFVPFFQKTSKIPFIPNSPLLVQCRSGLVGVGFFLLCDMNLRTSEKNDVVDVVRTFQRLIECSISIVDDDTKYFLLAHLAIAECLLDVDTNMSCESFTKVKMRQHFEHVKNTSWLDNTMRMIEHENYVYFRATSNTRGKVRLVSYTPEQLTNSSISKLNAVHVDGFRSPNKFIVTEQPTFDSFATFWSLIETANVSVIVYFCTPNSQAFTFWPNENPSQIHISKLVVLKYKGTDRFQYYNCIKLELCSDQNKVRNVGILAMTNWTAGKNVSEFVNFCVKSEEYLGLSHPVVVTCSEGMSASGLYLTMMYNIGKMKLEKRSDICTSVRMVRRYREDFFQKQEQLHFLYDATENYLKEFENRERS